MKTGECCDTIPTVIDDKTFLQDFQSDCSVYSIHCRLRMNYIFLCSDHYYAFSTLSFCLFQIGGTTGDGYEGQSSPHTQEEHFNGLSMKAANKVGLNSFSSLNKFTVVLIKVRFE